MRMVLKGRGGVAFLMLALGAGCSRQQAVDLRYRSEAIRKSVTEVKVFVFDDDGKTGAPPECALLDPRGLGPGDAEERTGFVAFAKAAGPVKETIAELPDLKRSVPYTLVIEAWGPQCAMASGGSGSEEPSCARFATTGAPVLRGYQCVPLDFEIAPPEVTVDLESFALISATMAVPNLTPPAKAIHYDADRPMPLVDGIEAFDRFLVQLLDHQNETANGVKVHWGIISGSGSFDVPTSLTAEDESISDGGFSQAVLRAGANASKQPDRKIIAYAHAPGFEGSPIIFEAHAVPSVEVDLQELDAPITSLPVTGPDPEFRPVLVEDLDGNGKADIVYTTGLDGSCTTTAKHQLVVVYQANDGSLSAHSTRELDGELRNLLPVRLARGANPSLMVFLSDACARIQSVDEEINGIPDPRTYVLEGPRIELFDPLENVPDGPTIDATPSLLRDLISCEGETCTNVRMNKAFVAGSRADIDGDGIDEIAATRCSYVYYAPRVTGRPEPQSSRVYCHGDLADRTDSQVALLTADFDGDGSFRGFRERASIDEEGGDGGFREVTLADINGDTSPDLVFATQTEVGTICGRRNMPDTGYGFGQVPPPPRADASITFAQGYSVGVGRFDGDEIADVVVTGALRAASRNAGVKMNPSRGCAFDLGEDAMIVGPRSTARRIIVRVADLNLDGFDDVVVLHRDAHEITTLFGNGTEILARGPRVLLPAGPTSELGLFVENRGDASSQVAVAATISPAEGQLFVLRFRP